VQDAEFISGGFLKRLVIGVVLSILGIEEFVDSRQMQNLHGSLLETGLDQTRDWLLGGLNPDVAVCRF
jgi:hypothetical protein